MTQGQDVTAFPNKWRWLPFSVLLCVLFLAAASCRRSQHGLNPGDSPPQLALQDLEGNPKTLADYQGQVVLLNFWATWCDSCLVEMPALNKLFQSFAGQGLVVVAVAVQDDPDKVRAYVKEHGLLFPVLLDRDKAASSLFQLGGFPESFILNRQGKLLMLHDPETDLPVTRLIGAKDWNSEPAKQIFSSLLGSKN